MVFWCYYCHQTLAGVAKTTSEFEWTLLRLWVIFISFFPGYFFESTALQGAANREFPNYRIQIAYGLFLFVCLVFIPVVLWWQNTFGFGLFTRILLRGFILVINGIPVLRLIVVDFLPNRDFWV